MVPLHYSHTRNLGPQYVQFFRLDEYILALRPKTRGIPETMALGILQFTWSAGRPYRWRPKQRPRSSRPPPGRGRESLEAAWSKEHESWSCLARCLLRLGMGTGGLLNWNTVALLQSRRNFTGSLSLQRLGVRRTQEQRGTAQGAGLSARSHCCTSYQQQKHEDICTSETVAAYWHLSTEKAGLSSSNTQSRTSQQRIAPAQCNCSG